MRRRTSRTWMAWFVPALALPIVGFAGPQAPQTQPAQPAAGNQHGENGAHVVKPRVMEGFPNRIQARIEQRNRTLRAVPPHRSGLSPHFLIAVIKRWPPGHTVTVAFKGGNTALHKQIADTVSEWTNYANLKLDFGHNAAGGYRKWSPSDKSYKADIRVSFDQPGFYSLVANDSINNQVTKPGEESLNLEGFDQNLPSDWKGVALHEFGHAIGFEHEHQSPLAQCDFRFEDDPGYVPTTDQFGQFITDPSGKRPGLYTMLGGPPNNWPQAVVDFNLKPLQQDSHAYVVGPFDKDSIMKYYFEPTFFVSGTASPCYTGAETLVLSDGDKAGAAKVYPKNEAEIKAVTQFRQSVLENISASKALAPSVRTHYENALKAIRGQ